jgi:predicted transposase YbfD/YdcC
VTGKLADLEWRRHIKTIIQVQRRVLTRSAATGLWNRSTDTAFYVSNTTLGASPAAKAIRAHWGIENTSHYSRDVSFGEDRSRIRTNPGVFARLRSFAFNILKANMTGTISQDRYRAALAGIDSLLKLVAVTEH